MCVCHFCFIIIAENEHLINDFIFCDYFLQEMGTSSNSVGDVEEMQQDVKKAVEEMVGVSSQYVNVI